MNISLSYKQIIGGLLLLLYTFIAMPVQCWHHHSYPSSVKKVALQKHQTSFERSTGQTVDANCSICSHQYSVYSQGATVTLRIVLPFIGYPYTTYIASIPETLYLHSSNKGPPAIG